MIMRWNRLFLVQFIIMAVIVLFQEMPVAGLVASQQRFLNVVQLESKLEAQSLTVKNKLTAVKKELSADGLSASQQSRLMSLQSQLEKELTAVTDNLAAVKKELSAAMAGIDAPQQRAADTKELNFSVESSRLGFGRFHALVIGNQNYRHLTKLKTPLADAKEVAQVLEQQYGFTVKLLLDKNRDEIMLALSELRKTMTAEEDSLLIYYAGHGYLDEASGAGYWQPVDAEKDNIVYWLPTSEISNLLRAIRVRHVLVVADSCYSGEIVMRKSEAQLPAAVSNEEWLRRMQAKRSRQALTSGLKEPVMDGGGGGHSIFAKALLEALQENRQILEGTRLFSLIKDPVSDNAPQQPVYDSIPMTGHDQGDFIFVPKNLQGAAPQEQPERGMDLSFLERSADSAATPPAMDNISVSQKKSPSLSPQNTLQQLEELPLQLESPTPQKGKTIGQYIDHGDGTVTDTKTGLMWKRCSEGLSGVNCEKGETEKYTWNEAVDRFKDIKYSKYSDWRLPNIVELKTLVHCSTGKDKNDECHDGAERPTINQQAFPNTKAIPFWSGSPSIDRLNGAWGVSFNLGHFYDFYRSGDGFFGNAVRLVRGGQ